MIVLTVLLVLAAAAVRFLANNWAMAKATPRLLFTLGLMKLSVKRWMRRGRTVGILA